jgi:hypothetical protein
MNGARVHKPEKEILDEVQNNNANVILLRRYPPTDEDKKAKLGAWFANRGPPMGVKKLPKIVEDIKSHSSSITAFGAIGVSLLS